MFLVYSLTDVIIPCAFFTSKENLPKATLQTSSDTSLASLSHGPISNQSQQGSKINMILACVNQNSCTRVSEKPSFS